MGERTNHKFQFPANQIATAAAAEAEYHEARVEHWQTRLDAAVEQVEKTISAKLIKQEMTSGNRYHISANYGDGEAWEELQLADAKVRSHREAAERHRTDAQVYRTQGDRTYELDTDDVHHFRLDAKPREE